MHRQAECIRDQAAQEKQRGCFMIKNGKPERIETKVDDDKNHQERNTDLHKIQRSLAQEISANHASQKTAEGEAWEIEPGGE